MEHVGRVLVLKDGVEINGGRVHPYQSVDFTEQVLVSVGDVSLSLRCEANGIHGSRFIWPEDSAFAPQNPAIIARHGLNIGHDPQFGAMELLGIPDATLRIEFLGHPERNLLEPVFYRQRDNYNPEFAVLLRPFNPRRVLVMTSPVFSANLYGVLEEPKNTFTTQAMLVAEVSGAGPWDEFNAQVHLRLMSIAGDWRLRVFEGGDWRRDRWEPLDNGLERLAKIALLTRHIDNPFSSPWLSQGFSLNMLRGLERYLQLRENANHDSVSAEHFRRLMERELIGDGFNILEILRSFNPTGVRIELQRLRDSLLASQGLTLRA